MSVVDEKTPRDARTDSEIRRCFDVMSELRTHLKPDEFLATVRHMESEGFQLAYIEAAGEIMSVAGYRIYTNLWVGRNLYVDDLVTSEKARSKGYGELMVRWLKQKAELEGCEILRLDSGTMRPQAHKFYFSQEFTIAAYHFVMPLM